MGFWDTSIDSSSMETSYASTDSAILSIKWTFIGSIAGFVVILLLFCRSKKSYFDSLSARNVVKCIRIFVFTYIVIQIIFLATVVVKGNPVVFDTITSYTTTSFGVTKEYSFLYGYGRPTAAITLVGLGFFSEYTTFIRFIGMIGCLAEIFFNSICSYEVNVYRNSSPAASQYSSYQLYLYYTGSVTSLAFVTIIFLLQAHLTLLMGCCSRLLNTAQVSGEMDRADVMRQQLLSKQQHVDTTRGSIRSKPKAVEGENVLTKNVSIQKKIKPSPSPSFTGGKVLHSDIV